MTTYLLVPGFWLGGWAWDAVAEPLRARGHQVIALTPAHDADATIESRVEDVVAHLRQHRDVVLVGHSGSGVVAVAAAERAREHVARVVLVDTGPLPEGMSYLDFVGAEVRPWVEGQLAEHGGWYPMPSRETLEKNGASTDGIDPDTWRRIAARATAEPAGVVTGSARRGTPDPALPKTVIACSFPVAGARGGIEAGHPAFAEMAGPEWSFAELPTGHWPMFSRPTELAGLLNG